MVNESVSRLAINRTLQAIDLHNDNNQGTPPAYEQLAEKLASVQRGGLHVLDTKYDGLPRGSMVTRAQVLLGDPEADLMTEPGVVFRVRARNTNEGAITEALRSGGKLASAFNRGEVAENFKHAAYIPTTSVEVGLVMRREREAKGGSTSTYPVDIEKIKFVRGQYDAGVSVSGATDRVWTPISAERGSSSLITLVDFAKMRSAIIGTAANS